MDLTQYVIAHKDPAEMLFWSQELGWTALSEATVFDEFEKDEAGDTPVVDGRWMSVVHAEEVSAIMGGPASAC